MLAVLLQVVQEAEVVLQAEVLPAGLGWVLLPFPANPLSRPPFVKREHDVNFA